jgi:hypothetical protein
MLTFSRHWQIQDFSGMIVAIILVVDPMFFRPILALSQNFFRCILHKNITKVPFPLRNYTGYSKSKEYICT